MTYAISGSGNIGEALARHFARSGIDVAIANNHGPESLAALAQKIGTTVTARTLQEALRADVVILAVPYRAHRAVADLAASWTGKILIDAMNPFGVPPVELKGQASSDVVASAFTGAKVVKPFNHLPSKVLAMDPTESGGRRVLFLSSNDEAVSVTIGKLLEALGFASIHLGKITEGGALSAMGGPLALQNLIKLG